jgi:predicted phosphodiesterase
MSNNQIVTTYSKIAFLGDLHGNTNNAYKLIDFIMEHDNPDLLIQVGDMGVMGELFEKYLNKLNKKLESYNIELWFIDGNHENFNWLLNKVKNPHGLNSITSKIKYIPRGTMLTLGKKNFYFCGGAFSIDKFMRTIYKSWWPQEILSKEETEELINYYNENYSNYKIDYFISHDTPLFEHYQDDSIFMNQSDFYEDYSHKINLRKIYELTKAPKIIHGHYHRFNKFIQDGVENITLNCDGSPFTEQYTIVEA